jgi:hypothetical protein
MNVPRVLVHGVQDRVTGASARLTSIHREGGTAILLTISANDLLWYN